MDRKLFLMMATLPAVAACAAEPAAPAPSEAVEEVPPAASPTSATATGMDLSGIVTCELLPEGEFASLAGGTVIQTYEGGGPTCTYLIDPPGDEAVATYIAHIQGVEITQPLMDYVRDYEVADWITGLGDEAYVQPAVSGGGFVLEVLVRGQYGIDFNGPDPEVMKAAARILIERIQP